MAENHLHLIDGKREFFIDLQKILFIKADHNYCDIYFVNGQKPETIRILIGHLWTKIKTLGALHTLIRVHKSTIVNLRYVVLFDRKKGEIVLECGDRTFPLDVAKAREKKVKEKVDILKGDNLKTESTRVEGGSELSKAAQGVIDTMARMNDLFLLAKSLNNENKDD